MNELTPWEEAIEYGEHIFGILPCGTTTAVLAHNGKLWKTYIDSGDDTKWGTFERDYDRTPLRQPLEEFVHEGPMGEMVLDHVAYNGREYQPEEMEVCFKGWRYEYERKRHFKRRVLKENISLPEPALFNRYGNCYTVSSAVDEVKDLYWNFISSTYEHRHSHHAVTNS